MVWETIQKGGKNVAKLNQWPNPVNSVVNVKILMCNQDVWVAQVELAAALAADWFWSNVIPSPRELERKALLGGYRCGFYLDVPVKSPVEILFGRDTALIIGEIAAPFAKFLFFWWLTSATYEALAAWNTVIYPQLYCVENKGTFYQKNGNSPIPGGGVSGAFTFQETVYDPFNLHLPFQMGNEHTIGPCKVHASFQFSSGLTGISNVQCAFEVDGVLQQLTDLGDCPAGQTVQTVLEYEWNAENDGVVGPWFSADSGSRIIPASASCITYIFDGGH